MRPFSIIVFLLISVATGAQNPSLPIMGWSSWNHFHLDIDEQLIKEQADAMINSGMYDAGYRYINIDDGYFGGRDSTGQLFEFPRKFPSGMRNLVDYIHSKGLKAGIYTDAGMNTCGSQWDADSLGIGTGIYGHIEKDCALFFTSWDFDFIKVDWCGGLKMNLDKETQYLAILSTVRKTNKPVVFNICCWEFPGEWAIRKADSWRISGDIEPTYQSICRIIDLNADLARYTSPGHFNDMDMLQVGRGMTYDEDKTHFSMWCMMASPLLAGNDLSNMTEQTIGILTNKEMIAVNQDTACIQAVRIYSEESLEVWVKELSSDTGSCKAVAIMNRAAKTQVFSLRSNLINVRHKAVLRDLWLHQDLGKIKNKHDFTIPGHGIVVLRVSDS